MTGPKLIKIKSYEYEKILHDSCRGVVHGKLYR